MLRRLLALVMVSFIAACGGSVDLLTDIPEGEANEVLSALGEVGVRARKVPGKEGTISLQVEQSQVARSIATLQAEGLPRERYARMGDVFRKEGLISSPLEERARYLWALSQELSATIAYIDGVVKARVHVVLPERSSGSDPALPSSAAVFIKYRHGYNIDDSIPQIKRLVANSIPGLSSEKVSVVLLQAMPRPAADPGTVAPGGAASASAGQDTDRLALYGIGALVLALLAAGGYFGWRTWGRKVSISLPAGLTGGKNRKVVDAAEPQ